MSTQTGTAPDGALISDYWRERRDALFVASCIALIVTAMSFAIRGNLIAPLGKQFGLDKEQLGWIVGTAFWGFTLAMIIGGPLCDVLGMKSLLVLAFVGHTIGIVMTILSNGFWTLFLSTLAFGLGNGFVEAACNPLIATLYPDQKIKRLSLFHMWFPGGIVIGGLTAYAIDTLGIGGQAHGWQLQMATMLIPLVIYAILMIGLKFPSTERVASGVSTGQMFAACLRPFFLLFVVCMCMTAVTELCPGQWIPNILTVTAGIKGILILVLINGLMAIGRTTTGAIVHRISPVVVLISSAFFGAVGLYGLSEAHNPPTAIVSAIIFACGVCFFWPTMLGTVNERFPKTGSLGLAVMGGVGMLASSFGQPVIGHKYDEVAMQVAQLSPEKYKIASEGVPSDVLAAAALAAHEPPDQYQAAAKAGKLPPAVLAQGAAIAKMPVDDYLLALKGVPNEALAEGGGAALRQIVVLPIILVFVFSGIFLYDKSRGGYKKEILISDHVSPEEAVVR